MNARRHLRTIGLTAGLIAASAGTAAAQDAAQFFRQNCASCHSIGGGRLVGPDLKNVTSRRDRAWLTQFILGPASVINGGDPYALQLKQDARGIVMPALPGLDTTLIGKLLDLIDAESAAPTSQFAGVQISERPFTQADVDLGRAIFRGNRRLASGGPPCISCHTVRGLGGLGGGQLGPDLTRVYERLQGRKGLATWLNAPATPTMAGVFGRTRIADTEITPLVAFFESAARRGGQDNRSGLLNFVLLGLGAAALGVVVLDSAWSTRFRSVRRALVESRRLRAANERQRVSHASGAGIAGAPASERVGGTGGAKPPGKS